MATKYFKTESVRVMVMDSSNHPIRFEPVAGGEGVLALDDARDAALIADLDKLAAARRGGIVIISPEIYESLKKNAAASTPSRKQSSLNQMRVSPSATSFQSQLAAPPVVVDKGIQIIPEPGAPSSIRQFKPRGRPVNQE